MSYVINSGEEPSSQGQDEQYQQQQQQRFQQQQHQQHRQQQQQHPLLLLRPPATDHLTYLTLIEHLLSKLSLSSDDGRRARGRAGDGDGDGYEDKDEKAEGNKNNDNNDTDADDDDAGTPGTSTNMADGQLVDLAGASLATASSSSSSSSSASTSPLYTVRLLHRILRGDVSLTVGIGWDLVQILLPWVGCNTEKESGGGFGFGFGFGYEGVEATDENEEDVGDVGNVADEAKACLLLIARCGNPREVVLKVGEGLFRLGRPDGGGEKDGGEEGDAGSDEDEDENEDEDEVEKRSSGREGGGSGDDSVGDGDGDDEGDGDVNITRQFRTLLSMLAILHQRIKTKRPSRFLASSLQAVLGAYESGTDIRNEGVGGRRRKGREGDAGFMADLDERTLAAVDLVRSLSGVTRPMLPERKKNAQNGVLDAASTSDEGKVKVGWRHQPPADMQHQQQQYEPDPEADWGRRTEKVESAGTLALTEDKDISFPPEETKLQRRLLQSFITNLLSRYMLATDLAEESSAVEINARNKPVGLAWSVRLLENLYPQRWGRSAPGQLASTSQLANTTKRIISNDGCTEVGDGYDDGKTVYLQRQATVRELVAVARHLGLTNLELKKAVLEGVKGEGNTEDGIRGEEHGRARSDSAGENSHRDIMRSDLDPPDMAEDVPLCKEGALFLLTARATARAPSAESWKQKKGQEQAESAEGHDNGLNGEEKEGSGESADNGPGLSLFPEHDRLLRSFLHHPGLSSAGTEPAVVVDALCALGIVAFETAPKSRPTKSKSTFKHIVPAFSKLSFSKFPNTTDFQSYIQTVSLLAATNPDARLRAVAHYLATSVLHAHPSTSSRLLVIRDVLEHCPFQNLKESAVGWLKEEIIWAVPMPASGRATELGTKFDGKDASLKSARGGEDTVATVTKANTDSTKNADKLRDIDDDVNIFATPVALANTASFLFPDLTYLINQDRKSSSSSSSFPSDPSSISNSSFSSANLGNSYSMSLYASVPLYIATLNFLYLLLSARHLRDAVDVMSLIETYAAEKRFLEPLDRYCAKILDANVNVDAGVDDADEQLKGELRILSMAVDRVRGVLQT